MKQLSIIFTLLFALVSGNGILKAAPLTAPADTLDQYFINGQRVEKFDGSQLVGKKIESYGIDTIISPYTHEPVRVHSIVTEGANLPEPSYSIRVVNTSKTDPAFVVDGKQVTKTDFENLNPSEIKSMTVIKNGSQEEVKKYDGWENGVILVETKAGAARGGKKK